MNFMQRRHRIIK